MAKLENTIAQWQKLQPLSELLRERLSRRFSIDFNYNSNHLEGNTLTYGQTEILLLFGRVVGEAKMRDLEEMKASNVGLRMMQEEANIEGNVLTETFIRQLHKVLLREDYEVYKQLPDGGTTSYTVHAGQYKTRPNSVITRYGDRFEYAAPGETPYLMGDLVQWYNRVNQSGELTPVQMAALFHYRFIRIHPFEDGNGRIARLMVNYILASHGLPMVVVRSRNKAGYLEALHQTDLLVGALPSQGAMADITDIGPFHKWFLKMMEEEISSYIGFVTESSENIWWFDGEKVVMRSPNTPRLLRLLAANPQIGLTELAKKLNISITAVQKQLDNVIKKGYVMKEPSWHVVIVPSK